MNRTKIIGWLALLAALCVLLSACGRKAEPPAPTEADEFSVYASFYPVYALAAQLVDGAEDMQLHCLVQPQDGCLRAYSLSDWDLALLANSADAVILGGRGLESFESLLYTLGENGPVVSSMLYDLELANRAAANTSADTDSHWLQDNPHIYMDVNAAKEITQRIAAVLSVLDDKNEAVYSANFQQALRRLDELKSEMDAQLTPIRGEKVIVMNEALLYADAAYGLQIDLCWERESGESIDGADWDACLNALRDSEARVALLEKQAPQQLVSALETAGYRVATLDVLSTRRADEGSEGYFEAQRANVRAILKAFNIN